MPHKNKSNDQLAEDGKYQETVPTNPINNSHNYNFDQVKIEEDSNLILHHLQELATKQDTTPGFGSTTMPRT
jgi:hypothetical protein